jgi:hypothetical protein
VSFLSSFAFQEKHFSKTSTLHKERDASPKQPIVDDLVPDYHDVVEDPAPDYHDLVHEGVQLHLLSIFNKTEMNFFFTICFKHYEIKRYRISVC